MGEEVELDLPDECWELVFRQLGHSPACWQAVSLTCRRFLYISNRSRPSISISSVCGSLPGGLQRILQRFQGLREIDLSNFHGSLSRPLKAIAEAAPALRSLNLEGQKEVSVEAMVVLGRRCPQLRELNFSRLQLWQNRDLVSMVKAFPLLENLDISWSRFPPFGSAATAATGLVTDAEVTAVAASLKHLRRVNLSGNQQVTDAALESLAWFCKDLREVGVFDCPGISDRGLQVLAVKCMKLETLGVNGKRVTAGGMEGVIVSSRRRLVCLNLCHMSLSDEVLEQLGGDDEECGWSWVEDGKWWPTFPLRKLVLAHCKGLTAAGLAHVARGCPQLRHLDLEGAHFLRDDDTVELARSFPELVYLRLNHCSMLTDISFVGVLNKCPKLETLEMEATAVGWGTEITLTQRQFHLQHLVLAWNRAVGDKLLQHIAKLCPGLLSLDLSNCLPVTGAGLAMVGKGCPKLTQLFLRGCKNVHSLEGVLENAGMIIENRCTMSENQGRVLESWGKMMANGGRSLYETKSGMLEQLGFRHLEHLELDDSGFTDAGLVAVSRHSRNLLYLGLASCNKVSDGGLKSVMEECKHLKQLNLKDCIGISNDALAWMVFCRQSLRKLVLPSSSTSEGERARLTRHGCELIKL